MMAGWLSCYGWRRRNDEEGTIVTAMTRNAFETLVSVSECMETSGFTGPALTHQKDLLLWFL